MYVRKGAGLVVVTIGMFWAITANGQTRRQQPVNDSAAQASPAGPVLHTSPTDAAAEASPIDEARKSNGHALPPHTTLHVVLSEGIDSGNLKNGQTVHGKLQSSAGAAAKAGTPVLLTVVGTVPAGKLNAVGEISLELVRVGSRAVETNILTYRGQPGHRDLPDSAPMIGTNAGLPAGTALMFTVQPPPSFAETTPRTGKESPGSVTQHVSGSKPANYGQPAVSSAPGSGVDQNGAPANNNGNNPQPTQNTGNTKATPNQMTTPANRTTTQPH